jgi:hypothetical protein
MIQPEEGKRKSPQPCQASLWTVEYLYRQKSALTQTQEIDLLQNTEGMFSYRGTSMSAVGTMISDKKKY